MPTRTSRYRKSKMYTLDEDDDLSALKGKSIESFDLGGHSVTLLFSGGIEATIESALEANQKLIQFPIQNAGFARRALSELVDDSVVSEISALNERNVLLDFSDGNSLQFDGQNEDYECYTITGPGIDIVI